MDQSYKEFLNSSFKTGDRLNVNISIEPESKKSPSVKNRLFESGGNWSLFLDGDNYLIEFRPIGSEEATWLAEFKRHCKEASVFCGRRLLIEEDGEKSFINPIHYPLDQILLMYTLAQREGLLIHATASKIKERGYIFSGIAGSGKSTISKLLDQRDYVEVLSDDRIIVRKKGGVYKAYGTPWPSDAGIAHNITVPLGGIFFIFHGAANLIREIKPKTAFERLLPVASIPWYDKYVMPGMLDLCQDLVSNVPVYELYFKPGSEVVDVLQEHIK